MTRVVLPYHLKALAKVSGEVTVEGSTVREVLDALEGAYPALRGTIRDQTTGVRRAYVRLFACEEDVSHTSVDDPLPAAVLDGREPLLVVGAMSGG